MSATETVSVTAAASERVETVKGIMIHCPAYTIPAVVAPDVPHIIPERRGTVLREAVDVDAVDVFVPLQCFLDLAHVEPWGRDFGGSFIEIPGRAALVLNKAGIIGLTASGHQYGRLGTGTNSALRDFVCTYYPGLEAEFD